MKKAGRSGVSTPSKLRANFQTALARSQSTGNIYHAKPQRLILYPGDTQKYPETLARSTPQRTRLMARTSSVPALNGQGAMQQVRHPPPILDTGNRLNMDGFLGLVSSNSRQQYAPQSRPLHKSPIKGQSNSSPLKEPGPIAIKRKLALQRPKQVLQMLPLDDKELGRVVGGTEPQSIRRRREHSSVSPLGQHISRQEGSQSLIGHGTLETGLPKSVSRVAFRTRTGAIGGRQKPHNQDSYLIVSDFNSTKNQYLLGIFDGHGETYVGLNGHDVSGFIKAMLPIYLDRVIPKPLRNAKENSVGREVVEVLRTAMQSSFLTMNQELLHKTHIDTSFSGSTAICVLVRGDLLLTSNLGDSRAVLGRKTESGWQALPLSSDHKPDILHERDRIEKAGGRVEPFVGKRYADPETGQHIGPARVWMPEEQIPGLAMSRSIGDYVASQLGVIAEPEVRQMQLCVEDKFLVIASDGVWEFMSNQTVSCSQCIDFITPYWEVHDVEGACERIVKEAVICWKRVSDIQEDEVIDDITLVLAFLTHD